MDRSRSCLFPPSCAATHWLPRALVQRCVDMGTREMLREFHSTRFLLVRLWDLQDSLTRGLLGTTRTPELPEGVQISTTTESLRNTTPAPSLLPAVGWLEDAVHDGLCFVRILDPRQFRRMRLGRSRSSEVVLRHTSVSRTHAWLLFDDRERLMLLDAHSKNCTMVGGHPLGDEPLLLEYEQPIQLGRVALTVVDIHALTRLLKA